MRGLAAGRMAALLTGLSLSYSAGAQVRITEYMYTGNSGEFVELTNVGEDVVSLAGWSLDDSHRVPGFIPIGSLASILPGESVVLTGDTADAFRTNWSLPTSAKVMGGTGAGAHDLGRSDEINIYNGAGELVDRLTYGDQTFPGSPRANAVSAWVRTDGLGINDCHLWTLSAVGDTQVSWRATSGDIGSPGAHTLGSGPVETPPPVLSHASGYYENAFDLTVISGAAGTDVHYTLDGTTPTAASPLLQPSISIHSRVGEPNVYSLVPTCPDEIWLPPKAEVFKVVVLKAIATRPGALPSVPVTHTYLVGPGVGERYEFPVISIVTEPDNLFGFVNGIYVPGKIYEDNYDVTIPPLNRVANYTQDGSAWERPAYMQFFETDRSLAFGQAISLRINGNITRAFEQKSLRVYADSQPGTSGITYPLFGDGTPAPQKRLILRNSGNDNNRAFCRDDLMRSLVKDCGVDTQASRFAIVFIDGEYWGIHAVRERFDKFYFQTHYGADPDNVDYLESYGMLAANVKEGDRVHYGAMLDFMHSADLTQDANIAQLETYMDLDNFLTYFAEEIYSANYDWPNNNIEYWRPRTPTGRWQWLLKDSDLGFNWGSLSTPGTDSIVRLLQDNTWATDIFRSVLRNQRVKERFINRLADLLNTAFDPPAVRARVEEFRRMLAPQIPEHIARWNQPLSVAAWDYQMNAIGVFGDQRPGFVRQHVVSNFSLAGTSVVTVASDNAPVGGFTLNTIRIVRDGAPFSGVYFKGIPVTLTTELPAGYCAAAFDGAPTDSTSIGAGGIVFDPQKDLSITVRLIRSADINADGGIDGSDVGAFFDAWETGLPSGDMNDDGGVDGADVSEFFSLWENGRC